MLNRYYCCGQYWENEDDYACDDRCGRCNKEVTPLDIDMEMLITLASRVAHLNPRVPEIGSGMLKTLVNNAKEALNITE